MSAAAVNDEALVAESLAGNRDAFGQIVARYQSLICSLAYSATGSLGQSEDLAQETFITAWKHLRLLRQPSRLRSWLCGIARNRINDCLRREGREPVVDSEPIESVQDAPAAEPLPSEHVISREEQALLWQALQQIPHVYREPLVLFYREHKSVERVAADLEISEDAVKQRLSRGRKLLQEQVLSFVEGALQRTNPGKAFTVGVLAALPFYATSAAAATIGAAAVKGSTTAKAAAATGLVAAIAGPLAAIFGMYLNFRAECDLAGSQRERRAAKKLFGLSFLAIAGFIILCIPLELAGHRFIATRPGLFAGLVLGLVAAYILAVAAITVWYWRERRSIALESKAREPEPTVAAASKPAWEYRSRATLLGLPLVHMRIGGNMELKRKPVKAWVAVGEVALGGLFAFGGIALAPLAIGGLAAGVVPFGGGVFGLVALGGFSVGWWSFGGCALGWLAFGGCAVGWKGAVGALALAREFALGTAACAAQFNNSVAEQFARQQSFFRWGAVALRYLFWLNLLWIIPMLFWWRVEKRARTRQ